MRGVATGSTRRLPDMPEMQDQRAGFGFEQQIFRAAARAADRAAGDGRDDLRDPPASAGGGRAPAGGDAPADDVRLDAAAGGFDFG